MDRRTTVFPLFSLLVALASCSDDTPSPSPAGNGVDGWITTVDSAAAVSIPVALLDGDSFIVVAGPVRTDSTGYYAMEDVPAGRYYLFTFTGDYWLFDQTEPMVEIRSGANARHDVRMVESTFDLNGGYRLEGMVIDSETGAGVDKALVSMGSVHLDPYFGGVIPSGDAITGADGRYSIDHAYLLIDETGNSIGIFPVGVSKEGYIPFVGLPIPLPEPPGSTATYNVGLSRAAAGGRLEGRILFEGEPVSGIIVGLNLMEPPGEIEPDDKETVPVLGASTFTDSEGRYEFTGLQDGVYSVDAAYFPDDGYLLLHTSEWISIREDGTGMVEDLEITRAIVPHKPTDRLVLDTLPERLVWSACPGADRYSVGIANQEGWIGSWDTADTVLSPLSIPEPLMKEYYRWGVFAFSGRTVVSDFEELATFTVTPGSSDSLSASRRTRR